MRGRLRVRSQDFEVEEELAFVPDGDGEHQFLRIEKTDANTAWVAEQLARFADVPVRDVGFSGLKDRHAVTRQWFSVRARPRARVDWTAFRAVGVRVLETTANRRKLRRGAHRNNHFRIVMRDLEGWSDAAADRLARIAVHGVPNYFGEQRFGRAAGNLDLAEALAAGRRLSRKQRAIAISTARAWLFNHVLDERVANGSWRLLSAGDCANLDGSGSFFLVEKPDDALAQRAASLDIHPTGPLWGRGDLESRGEVETLERGIAARFAVLAGGLEKAGAASDRRALRVAVRDLRWAARRDVLELSFSLTRGAFATAVLRELASYRVANPPPRRNST